MRARFHVAVDRIDYMVLISVPGAGTRWLVFAKDPAHTRYSARLSGADLTRSPG